MAQGDLDAAVAAFQRGDLAAAARLAEPIGSAQSSHLLGLIECRRGDFGAGIAHLRDAAEAEPDNAAHRLMLARALIDAGRASDVLGMDAPARDGRPESLALWHARAEAAHAAGSWPEAVEAWRIVAPARANDWRTWSSFGDALAALAQWRPAVEALRRAVFLNREEASIRVNLAAALGRIGRHADSVTELEAAVRLDPADLESRLTLSRLYSDLGRQRESLAELSRATEMALANAGASADDKASGKTFGISFDKPRAGRELGLLLERTNRLAALRQLLDEACAAGVAKEQFGYLWAAVELKDGDPNEAKRLLVAEGPGEDPVRWHRLLVRIEDKRGDFAAAFEAAVAMNRAVHGYDDWRKRGLTYRTRIREAAARTTPEWGRTLPAAPAGSRASPAFILGFPRSGTTLLDTFLMGHPGVRVLEEVHTLAAGRAVLGPVAGLADCAPDKLAAAREAYFAELDRHVEAGFDGLVVDKMPLNMLALPFIHALFPDAKVIFAQRHPADAVLSGFMQSFVLNDAMASFLDIEDAADLYDAAMDSFMRARAAVPLSIHTLTYEDLVVRAEATLRILVDFLGLDWRDELLDHQATARGRGAIITPSYDQVAAPLTKAPSGRWKRYQEHLAPVLPVLLPWAKRLGYAD